MANLFEVIGYIKSQPNGADYYRMLNNNPTQKLSHTILGYEPEDKENYEKVYLHTQDFNEAVQILMKQKESITLLSCYVALADDMAKAVSLLPNTSPEANEAIKKARVYLDGRKNENLKPS